MRFVRSRFVIIVLLAIAILLLTACEFTLPSSSPSASPEPTATVTPIPTPTPRMPDGPYPPVVLDYTPLTGQEVPVDTLISIHFDQPMDRQSVATALRFSPEIEGELEWQSDSLVIFHPDALQPATRYRVAIGQEARAITDLSLTGEVVFTFTTLSPLQVTQVGPADGATGLRIDVPVYVAFNRAIVSFDCVGVKAGEGCSPLPLRFDPAVLGSGTWIDTSLYRFDVYKGWGARRTYQVTLLPEFIDVEGTMLSEPVIWSFTTASPTIQSTVPANAAQSVPLETGVRVNFNTPMDRETTAGEFRLTSESGATVPGTITWLDNGAIMIFTPTQRLSLGTQYSVRIGQRARAATSVPLDNPQTWTFMTVAQPSLVSTNPADGATAVRVPEPVRFTFAGAIDAKTLENRVLVTPTSDSLYTYFDPATGVLQLSWKKTPRTEYCVFLLPGIADIYGDVMETPEESCFVTGDLDPYFAPVTDLPALTLDAAAPMQLQFLARNRNSVDFTLVQLTETDFIRGWNASGTTVVRSWEETLPQTPRNSVATATINLTRGRSLSAGYYELMWQNPPWGTQSLRLAVVDRHVLLKLAAEEAVAWVTDLHSGEPVSRTVVQLMDQEGLLIAAGTTGADGLAYIPISPREDLWESVAAVVGEPGLPGFGVALTHWMGDASPSAFDVVLDGSVHPPFTTYLYTDRPLYHPGKAVHFRGVVREEDTRYRMLSLDTEVVVSLRDPLGEEVYSDTVDLTSYGTFDSAVVLAEDAPLGDYLLEAHLPAVGATPTWPVTFTVAAYLKPEFEVSVVPEYEDVLNGDNLRALVSANYFLGSPVSGARVEWVVRSEGSAVRADCGDDWIGEASSQACTWGPTVVAEGDAVTDAAGRFLLDLPANWPLDTQQTIEPQRWSMEVTVLDGNGNAVTSQAAITFHPARFYLSLASQQRVVAAGSRTQVDVMALDWSGLMVADQDVSVSLVQREWHRVVLTDTTPSSVWRYTDTVVSAVTVKTDVDGKAAAMVTPSRSGHYIVMAESVDVDNNPVLSEVALWVGGNEVAQWQAEEGRITPVSDALLYQVGDTARVLVPTPFDGPYQMLMTVERDGILDVERRVFDNANPIIEIPIAQNYVPNVYVSFVVIGPASESQPAPDVRAGYVTLNVAPVNQILTVEVVPDKSVYGPGESVSLTLRALDVMNHRVDAEISVAVVDKAVLSLPAVNVSSILDAFYGERPLRVVSGDSSLVLFNRIEQRFQALPGEALLKTTLAQGANGVEGELAQAEPSYSVFPDTILWAANVRTGDTHVAQLSFDLPDSLTTWVVDARAVTAETQVGETRTELVVTKPLLVRPVTPRFLVAGDRPEVAAIIHNNTDSTMDVTAFVEVGEGVELIGAVAQVLEVPAGGRARVAWTLAVLETNVDSVALTFSVGGGGYSDVAQPTVSAAIGGGLPVYRYVSPDVIGTAGVVTDTERVVEVVIMPPEAGDDSVLAVHVEPSIIGVLVESLQVLDEHPYATTDVLVGRLLPKVLTLGALQELQVKDSKLTAQLTDSIMGALEHLYARQNSDGGWGWWMDWSNLHLSTYATLGLVKAKQAGFAVRQDVLDRALSYVRDELERGLQTDARYPYYAFALYVLSEAKVPWPTGAGSTLYAARDSLGGVGRAYLALAYGTTDSSDTRLLAMLEDLRSAAEVTATGVHWESDDDFSWNTDTVATSIILNVFANFAPDDPFVELAIRWLISVRRADQWETTYETTWAIVGLSEAIRVTGDLGVRYDWTVALNGEVLARAAELEGTTAEVWGTRIGIPPLRRTGVNVLEIVRGEGLGRLFYTVHLHATLPVDQLTAESRGIQLRREYCAVDATASSASGECTPVEEIHVGDVVEVRLTLIVPRTRHYVMLEDLYPAGMEPQTPSDLISLTSAVQSPEGQYVWWQNPIEWQALRDDRAVFFTQELAAGTYQITYRVRAIIPGKYHALPATVMATYFPEVWGRTDAQALEILPALP